MFLLLFLVIPLVAIQAPGCYNRFPLIDTVDTIKSLVRNYGAVAKDVDPDGTEWVNVLIPEREEGLELDGVTYFLNDNHLPPEQTFYFNQLQFLSTPVYVIPKDNVANWKPSVPDNTYLLSKISLTCPPHQRVCGLRCCSEVNSIVQQLFVDKSRDDRLKEDTTVKLGEVTYALVNRNQSCDYTFSYYDRKIQKVINGIETTVYFDCPTGQDCCGLSCSAPPKKEQSRLPAPVATMDSTNQLKQSVLTVGCVIFMVLFALVTALNYRLHRRNTQQSQPQPIGQRDSRETQTTAIYEKEDLLKMESGQLLREN